MLARHVQVTKSSQIQPRKSFICRADRQTLLGRGCARFVTCTMTH